MDATWIIVIAVVAVVAIAIVLRFFMSVAVELLRVGLVVAVLLVIGYVLWWFFWR